MKAEPLVSHRPAVRQRATQTHAVRIIGGAFKRTRLPVADKPGLRPTPDRVRETLFNWLGQDLTGWRCLDAFAGTGVLGFESASRGAQSVQLVENDPALVAQLRRIQAQLEMAAVHVVRGDGVAVLERTATGSIDLVFLDPPFDSNLFEPAVLAAGHCVAQGGFVYLEAPVRWTDASLQAAHLQVWRYLKAGAVHAHLLEHR
ncbi:ribosomal RNA small subunit methyltransferase D [mine drainage metagenome]|uniref:Ribosomal RNA small subunit methyltransferase D n=1 Tax=mine drainage metagenome TaxID=410659 RepID=A0A1J5PEF8_9ZZZZ